MLTLNTLNSTSKKRKRVGRGGSRGGTSGKGHKGQKARSGGSVRVGFEGGQMPLFRRLPKRGFSNARFMQDYEIVGLDAISKLFDDGAQVTKEALIECGLVHAAKGRHAVKVKVLAGSSFSKKLIVQADKFSKTAQEMITSNGGEAHIIKEN